MKEELRELLVEGFGAFGISVNEGQINAFDLYIKELIKWNSKYNLTAIINEKDIIIKHILDSAITLTESKCHEGEVADIGSGAGFPGLVLKIVKPEISLTSVDAHEKKIFFQKNVMRMLKINSVKFVAKRVDDSEFIHDYNNFFHCVMSRALKPVNELLTFSYPIVKKGGCIFILKGKNYKFELDELKGSDINDRFELKSIKSYSLPHLDREHYVLLFNRK